MEHVTATQAADLTGQSERTIRRWIQSGKLRAHKVAPNRYEIAVADLPPRKRSPLADLRAEIADLRARIERLEAANASVARYNQNLSVDAASYTPTSTKPPDAHYSATISTSFPTSLRGRARWVEEHGGPKASYVRDWPDAARWLSPEDAIASVRRRRGWEDWTPDA